MTNRGEDASIERKKRHRIRHVVRRFFRGPWFGLAAAVLVGFYFHSISQENREPVFVVDDERIEIFDPGRVQEDLLQVTRKDGQMIEAPVYVARYYLWNNGRASIRPENVLRPLTIRIDSSARLLSHTLVSPARDVANVSVTADSARGANALGVNFDILEEGDGVSGQIVYEGQEHAPISITGVVEGVRSIRSNPGFDPVSAGVRVAQLILVALAGVGAVLPIYAFDWLQERTDRYPRMAKWMTWTARALMTIIISFLVIAVVATIVVLIVQGGTDFRPHLPTHLR